MTPGLGDIVLILLCVFRRNEVKRSSDFTNGRDWHTLLEFCGLVDTLIVDEEGVYDPRHPNDRLLLGMKGTMSEMELSVLRQRSLEALKQKARRGELFMTVAIGYVRVGHDRIEKDPDRRIAEAIDLVFAKFAEMQSVRQAHLWFRHERVPLPAIAWGAEGRRIEWKLPVYNTILHMLTNPIYAGAYAFGRTGSRVSIQQGRKNPQSPAHRARRNVRVVPGIAERTLSIERYPLHSMIARNKRPSCIDIILTLRHPRRNRRNSVRVLVSYRALLRARAFRPMRQEKQLDPDNLNQRRLLAHPRRLRRRAAQRWAASWRAASACGMSTGVKRTCMFGCICPIRSISADITVPIIK